MLVKTISAAVDEVPSGDGPSGDGSRPGRLPLDGLPGYLGTGAEQLLIGVSVYREPADRAAVLFQVGVPGWPAAPASGQPGPAPPYQAPADLAEMLAVCEAAGMLTVTPAPAGTAATDDEHAIFIEAWLASELHRMLTAAGRAAELTHAHRRAAQYWQWRSAAWPQGRQADVHDLLEARHHLLDAGDNEQASALTDALCARLHAWGDLSREAALIHETLERLPACSAGRAGWVHDLGRIAEVRGDYADAQGCYQQALDMSAAAGDGQGVSRGHHSLGVLAQAQGDYASAEHRYRQAAQAAADPGVAAEAAETAETAAPGPAPAQAAAPVPMPAQDAASPVPAQAGTSPRSGHRHRARWASSRRRPGLAAAALAIAAMAAAVLSVVQISSALTAPAAGRPSAAARGVAPTAALRLETAIWVKRQVSDSAIVACDPAMCAALQAQAVPAGNLLALGPAGSADPLGSDVVLSTAAVRSQFGTRLASVYAPVVVARFGAGSTRIEVRVVAPDGSAAYLSALRSDLLGRRRAGAQLLLNKRITVGGTARRQLADGRVDTRLLMTVAVLARLDPLRVIGFSRGPGASAEVPMAAIEISARNTRQLESFATFLRAQRPPFLAASVETAHIANGQPALRIQFAYPGPLGLLAAQSSQPANVCRLAAPRHRRCAHGPTAAEPPDVRHGHDDLR